MCLCLLWSRLMAVFSTLPRARAVAASSLLLIAGGAWLFLSVFRTTDFSPSGQSPSLRALVNPFYAFSVVMLLSISLLVDWRRRSHETNFPRPAARSSMLLATALLLLLLAAYANSFALSPLSDDFAILVQARDATLSSYFGLFTHGQAGIMVRPLSLSLLLAEYNLWGQAPEGYRLVNLLLHFFAALGVAVLALDLRLSPLTAWAAAALFALHPIHPESTVWIVSLITIQAGACVIWSLHFYLRFRLLSRTWHLVLALVLAAMAMLSKETGYVLPLLVVSHDLIVSEPSESWRVRLWRWAPFALLLLAGGLYRFAVVGGVGGYSSPSGLPSFLDFHTVKAVEALLVRSPALSTLAINWSLPLSWLLKALAVLWVLALTAVVTCTNWRTLPSRSFAFFLSWIVLTALPAYHLLLVGGDLLGARNLYLPAAGGALLLAVVVTAPASKPYRRWLSIATLLVLLSLYVAALEHNLRAWRLASEKTRQILDVIVSTIPSPPPHTDFWVVGLPKQVNGVYLQTVGLSSALNLHYGRRDLTSQIFSSEAELPPPSPGVFVFHWDAGRQQLEAVRPTSIRYRPAHLYPTSEVVY